VAISCKTPWEWWFLLNPLRDGGTGRRRYFSQLNDYEELKDCVIKLSAIATRVIVWIGTCTQKSSKWIWGWPCWKQKLASHCSARQWFGLRLHSRKEMGVVMAARCPDKAPVAEAEERTKWLRSLTSDARRRSRRSWVRVCQSPTFSSVWLSAWPRCYPADSGTEKAGD